MKNFKSVDDYIASAPAEVHKRLKDLRQLIKESAPQAQEKIGYGMPAYMLNGPLIYFAAFKDHIGLYPTSSKLETEIQEAARFRTGKGTLQFPLDQPLPLSLIRKIVEYRVQENSQKKSKE